MKRTTTLIVTVGRRFDPPSERVADVSDNVARQAAPDQVESVTDWVDQLRPMWTAAQRRSTIYTIMTRDPLGPVVREWARRLDGEPSELELAIGLLSDAPLPDFYLVDPSITGSVAHWYLDHLPRLAPRRIVLIEPTEDALLSAVRRLPYGKSLPTVTDVLASARTYVPLPALDTETETTLLT
jgi:hypothetical protein